MTVTPDRTDGVWGPVTVTRDDDGLLVVRSAGATTAETHLAAAIDVAGATLVVDVTAGDVPPTAHVFDAYWCLTWLSGVYGDAVADRVKELAAAEPAPTATSEPVDAARGYLSAVVVRLGVATWLHRWWPSGNPELSVDFSIELLELEIGALRWTAEAAFIDTEPIERVLRPHVETLRASYDWNRHEHDGLGQEVVDEVLTTALRAVVETLPEGVPGYLGCAELLGAIDGGAQLSPDDWRLFAELLEDQQALALARGRSGASAGPISPTPVGETWWTTADVRDVPPRYLSDVDGNVEIVVEPAGDGARVVVTALAAPALPSAPVGAPLMARVLIGQVPLIFALTWTPAAVGAVFRGSAALPADAPTAAGAIDVGVFHPLWAGGARLSGSQLERAERERTDITGFLVDRYARCDARLEQLRQHPDPSERPTAAEIVARFRDG